MTLFHRIRLIEAVMAFTTICCSIHPSQFPHHLRFFPKYNFYLVKILFRQFSLAYLSSIESIHHCLQKMCPVNRITIVKNVMMPTMSFLRIILGHLHILHTHIYTLKWYRLRKLVKFGDRRMHTS